MVELELFGIGEADLQGAVTPTNGAGTCQFNKAWGGCNGKWYRIASKDAPNIQLDCSQASGKSFECNGEDHIFLA